MNSSRQAAGIGVHAIVILAIAKIAMAKQTILPPTVAAVVRHQPSGAPSVVLNPGKHPSAHASAAPRNEAVAGALPLAPLTCNLNQLARQDRRIAATKSQ
jgi:hypothetical protein